jgi:gamma-butyrobetaine dioxygenase
VRQPPIVRRHRAQSEQFGAKPKAACVAGIDDALAKKADMIPRRTANADEVFALVRSDGAAILSAAGSTRDDARAVAQRVLAALAPIVPDPAPIKEGGGNRDRSYITSHVNDAFAVPFQSGHTDGFAYGDKYPDYIFLLCVRPAISGGESFVVDTYGLLDALAASAAPDDTDLAAFLHTVPVEQTEPGFLPSFAPAIGDNGRGRRMSRWTPVQRPAATLTDAEQRRQRALLARWSELTHQASLAAPRFLLQAGEALCIDNYRMLHGRSGFDDLERSLWRIWAWTSESLGGPDGLLFSDSRFAVVE